MSNVIEYVISVFPFLTKYGNDYPKEDKLINHLNFGNDRYRGEICTDVVSGLRKRNNPKKTPFYNGVIPLFQQSYKDNSPFLKRISCNEYFLALSERVEEEVTVDNIKYYVSVYHSLSSVDDNGESVVYLSLYNLLSTIKRLLDLSKENINKYNIISILVGDAPLFLTTTDDLDMGEKVKKLRKNYVNVGVKMYESLVKLSKVKLFDAFIEDIENWLSKCSNKKCIVTSYSMYGCWKYFFARCMDITNSSKLSSIYQGELTRAGALYGKYLKAFSDSFDTGIKQRAGDVYQIIQNCPLWNIWFVAEEKVKTLHLLTDNLYIAPVEISFDMDRFERLCTLRMVLLKKITLQNIDGILTDVVKNQVMVFEKWWEDIIKSTEASCISSKDDTLNGAEMTKQRIMKTDTFIKRLKDRERDFKSGLISELNEMKGSLLKEAKEVVERDLDNLKSDVKKKVSTAAAEVIASEILKSEVKRFGQTSSAYNDMFRVPFQVNAMQIYSSVCAKVNKYIGRNVKLIVS